MRVLFTGGGTAGHINPALAVAGYLQKKEADVEILYVGNRGGMEERLVKKAGYDMAFITISGFQRKLTPKNIFRRWGASLLPRLKQKRSSSSSPPMFVWEQEGMSVAR